MAAAAAAAAALIRDSTVLGTVSKFNEDLRRGFHFVQPGALSRRGGCEAGITVLLNL